MLVERRPLGIALWQWIALIVLAGLAVLLARLLVALGLLVAALRPPPQARGGAVKLPPEAVPPLRLLVAIGVFHAGRIALALPVAVQPAFNSWRGSSRSIAVTWLAMRLMDVVRDMARARRDRARTDGHPAVVDFAQRVAKVVVLVLGLLTLLDVLGVNVTALIAGLGVGGIAVALAAQKTVEHLFGGLTLIADQPVKVGDFCRFGDQVGTVERIGMRSTRVRTLDRTVVSVPNAEFANLRLENFAERDRIWLRVTLGLRYETTPDQLRHVLVHLRELLYAHPRIDPDPAASASWAPAPTRSTWRSTPTCAPPTQRVPGVREDLYLRIMDVVAASGTGFAFPSQTNYSDAEGLDPTRARLAETEVEQWRADGTLPCRGSRPSASPASGTPWTIRPRVRRSRGGKRSRIDGREELPHAADPRALRLLEHHQRGPTIPGRAAAGWPSTSRSTSRPSASGSARARPSRRRTRPRATASTAGATTATAWASGASSSCSTSSGCPRRPR